VHAIALMLACCRDIARMDREVRSRTWSTREGVQLFGKTLGVIGLGGIGREVLRIGCGLGMQVIAWNRTPRPGEALVALDELLIRSDVIAAPRAQRRHPRISWAGAGGAHEAWRDPHQSGAWRVDR
jgi:D-3-phosphoglycerate dehydrogenase